MYSYKFHMVWKILYDIFKKKKKGNTLVQGPILIINYRCLLACNYYWLFISTYKTHILYDHILHP